MIRRNPIDRFFKRKLQYHSVEAPMALWEQIDARREQQKMQIVQGRKRRGLLLLLLLAVAGGFSALIWTSLSPEKEPTLSNFPIRTNSMAESGADPAAGFWSEETEKAEETRPTVARIPRQKLAISQLPTLAESAAFKLANPILSSQLLLRPESKATQGQAKAVFTATKRLPTISPGLKRKYSEDVKCADFKPSEKGKWSLDLMASPDWSFRSLKPQVGELAEYVETREATERPDYNYSVGMRVSYTAPSGFLGRVGLNYSQINEKFEFSTENEEVITIRNIYGPGGDVIGTDTLRETSVRQTFTNNRYQSIDLPLILGYEKDFKKLSLSLNAGVLINLSFDSKGDFISPMDGRPVSFDPEKPDSYPAFRNKLALGWYFSSGLAYKLSPKFHLLLEPHLRFYPKTITNDQYLVSQKYTMTGLSVGIRHQM